jgi:hypothetical protein
VQVLPLNHNTKIFRFGLAKRDLALSLPLGLHIQVRYARTVLPSFSYTSASDDDHARAKVTL